MTLNLVISEDEYPHIFKIYKKDRDKKLEEVFKTGYNIHFPNVQDHNKQIEYHMILKSIEDMKSSALNDSSMGMDSKLEDLLQSIQKLTGIGNNSSKKGEVGENMLEEIINQRYGDIFFENKAKTPHSGDAWLHLPDKKVIMLESKNYNYRINKDEIEQMECDMKTNHIRFGVFASWNSTVQSRKDLDIHSFTHNGESYIIIVISNLATDIIKLDLSIQIIRKLSEYFHEMRKFPWIINDIKQNLNNLDKIIQKNYQLRDGFYSMSNSVRNSMDMFYSQLRDYQYEINKCSQEIIDKINSTMDESMKDNNDYNIPDMNILSDFQDNSKLFPIMTQILDVFCKLEISLVKDSDNIMLIFRGEEEIGHLKIQKKKIIIFINKFNITLDLDSNNYSDSLQVLPNICKNI